jgi:diguanylate cyclase (GGDEF)-like protein
VGLAESCSTATAAQVAGNQVETASAEPAEVESTELVNDHESHLAEVRLGMASSLYLALRQRHAATAAHSLRVALGCSSWALYESLDAETRDVLELASLMHDLGKLGLSDAILNKPSRLNELEEAEVARCRRRGWQVLAGCCQSEQVLAAVRWTDCRYDGVGSPPDAPVGGSIPLPARMIAIVDAFDSMTTDQIYRRAKSREGALTELLHYAGSQFDPELVKQFVGVMSQRQDLLTEKVATRWLTQLTTAPNTLPWPVSQSSSSQGAVAPVPLDSHGMSEASLFEEKLVNAMHDGVVFVDAQSRIFQWSKGSERLTGISGSAACGRTLEPGLLQMATAEGRRLDESECPIRRAINDAGQVRERMLVLGKQGEHVAIDLHAIAVLSPDGIVLGATVLLHDAQPEASLEERCEALHDEVTKDPLTKVANRAEFDRMLALFTEAHQQAELPCSLIMVDIDHFKRINDTYGHQAGDEAIISVANLLKSACRTGDLVARYGGEEFAVLCADCNNVDATARADQIRRRLAEANFACLGNKRITASFGVTQLQAGDVPETMLRRADRALLQAKDQGRNQVVQLGDVTEGKEKKKSWWSRAFKGTKPMIEAELISAVPVDIAIEKLRGFVSDQQAKIISTHDNVVEMQVSSEAFGSHRRKVDRPAPFLVTIVIDEERLERTNSLGLASGEYARTKVRVTICPKKARQRRQVDQAERARLIMQSLKAYLMAKDRSEDEQTQFQSSISST